MAVRVQVAPGPRATVAHPGRVAADTAVRARGSSGLGVRLRLALLAIVFASGLTAWYAMGNGADPDQRPAAAEAGQAGTIGR